MTLIPDRLDWLASVSLVEGAHESVAEGVCAMEAVAYIAGEPHSDHPACACPVISAFLRAWNDGLPDDASRDRLLKPLLPRLVGTRNPDAEQARAYLAMDWNVRVFTPTWLSLVASCQDSAAELRALPEIRDHDSLVAAIEPCKRAEKRAAAGWDAARAAARAAAWAAARDAARAAGWDAAGAAGWDAAGAAGWDAAWDAARAAARDAARAAGWDAAGDALSPTVETLQQSALDLVERMIAVGVEEK